METVQLLWRDHLPTAPRRGRPARVTVDDIVAGAIRLADRSRSLDFPLRELADSLGVSVMALYSHVADKDQLQELMVDAAHATMAAAPSRGSWQQRLRQVATENRILLHAHPWLAEWESERAVLGPGTLAKYDRELAAVEPLPLADEAKDAALTLVLDFVRADARARVAAEGERAVESPEDWWQREGALLAELGIGERFPLASRIGTAAGQASGAARDVEHAFTFGLAVILDGIDALTRH